jgi:hypothetical protein
MRTLAAGPVVTTAPPATRAEALTRRAVAMIVLSTAALFVVVAIAGFGGQATTGALSWAGDAQVFTHPTIPGDRVLTGTLRNGGTRTMRVDIGDVRLLTAGGEVVPSTPVFLRTSGRALWASGRGPQPVPDSELLRTGRITLLSPGEEVPLTIAWHGKDGAPERVEYQDGSLPAPG